jgi:hypothetical protein
VSILASLSVATTARAAWITAGVLGSTLMLSLSGNAWLLQRLGGAREKAAGEIAEAVQRGRADALAERADQMTRLATLAEIDRTDVLRQIEAIAASSSKATVVYRDRIREIPAATCAPGQERIDAANQLISGE